MPPGELWDALQTACALQFNMRWPRNRQKRGTEERHGFRR